MIADQVAQLDALVADYLRAQEQMKAAQEQKKAIAELIAEKMAQAGTEKYRNGEASVTVRTTVRRTIVRDLLIAHGVDADVIDRSTKETTSEPFIEVRPARVQP